MSRITICFAVALFALVADAHAQLVRFDSVFGKYDVQLFENTPLTNANFLNYINDGDYTNSIVHRSAKTQAGGDFVIQGGGFTFDGTSANPIVAVPIDAPVTNEPGNSNVRGTIAMAKRSPFEGEDPSIAANSADSQWFVNLIDNTFLDPITNNGGFTAFGFVTADGMDIFDLMAAVPRFDATVAYNNGALSDLPLNNFDNTAPPVEENFLIFKQVAEVSNALGDLDGSGAIDAEDVDLLFASYGPTPTNDIELDLDSSGDVGESDLIRMIERIAGTRVGDLNFDGDVDVSQIQVVNGTVTNDGDASVLLASLGILSDATYAQGDLNGDGDVDISQIEIVNGSPVNLGDASILLANLGFSNAGAAPASQVVPEPSCGVALFAILAGALRRRRAVA